MWLRVCVCERGGGSKREEERERLRKIWREGTREKERVRCRMKEGRKRKRKERAFALDCRSARQRRRERDYLSCRNRGHKLTGHTHGVSVFLSQL